MKRTLSCLGLATLLLLLVGGGAWFYLTNRLDADILAAIEREGSAMTGAPVRVESVSISLREGRGILRGLTIGNPHGFTEGTAIRLEEINLTINVDDLSFDIKQDAPTKLVIEELLLRSPHVQYILDADGNSNIAVLQENIERMRGARAAETASSPERVLLEVKTLRIDGTQIAVDASAVGGDSLNVDLKPIEMRDLGSPKGLPPGQIGDLVLSEITSRTTSAVAKEGVLRFLDDKLGQGAKDLGNSLLKKVFGE